MIDIGSIRFQNLENGDDALAVVRCAHGKVWLCLSTELNGDVEIAFDKRTAQTLVDALQRAIDSE